MSSKKRPFQILDEMNVEDIKNNTATCGLCPELISAQKVKQGAIITMGAPESVLTDILSEKVIPILVLLDKEVYYKKLKEAE